MVKFPKYLAHIQTVNVEKLSVVNYEISWFGSLPELTPFVKEDRMDYKNL